MKLTIVIPTREEVKDIGETVRQFKTLTIPHEVIVADAHSSDGTADAASAAGARVVMSEDRVRSPAHQRNAGGKAAAGDLLVFVDTTVRLPNIDAFIKRAVAYFDDPRVVGIAVPQWIYPEIATAADVFVLACTNAVLQFLGIGSGKFVMTRRSAFEQLGGFREDLMTREDGDFFVRLKGLGRVVFARELAITYAGRREHAWGWPKLLWVWVRDTVAVALFNRSASADWKPVR